MRNQFRQQYNSRYFHTSQRSDEEQSGKQLGRCNEEDSRTALAESAKNNCNMCLATPPRATLNSLRSTT